MRYKIIGDSCLDLTKEMRKDPCYSMIPLTLVVGERHFVDDETFDQKEFIKVVKEYPECPKSACPSPEMFKEAYCCEEENVFVITLSAALSGSYNSCLLYTSAFSGAQDFLNKYKDKANEDQIIGHFGLGFYSAFMVADKVTIDTLSYRDGEKPVHWESEGGTEFSMDEGDRSECGTSITLYLNEDSVEFANEYRAREVIEKYCAFMPVPIFLENTAAEPQYETIEKDELTDKDTIVAVSYTHLGGALRRQVPDGYQRKRRSAQDTETTAVTRRRA